MATSKKRKASTSLAVSDAVDKAAPTKRPREQVMDDICLLLEGGASLRGACRQIPDAPTPEGALKWTRTWPDTLGSQYLRAREIGYALLQDEILAISDETHAEVTVQDTDPDANPIFNTDGTPALKTIIAPLSSDVIGRNRLRMEARKWVLSKMLPKVYGDKVVQELVGPNGGAVQMAAASLKGLSDDELETMQKLMAKAAAAAIVPPSV